MVDRYIFYGFLAVTVLLAVFTFTFKNKRGSLGTAAICAAVGAASAYYHGFWMAVIMGLGVIWALICAANTIDLAWRAKTGLTVVIGLGAFICAWPTLNFMSKGKIPCPAYVKEKVSFRLLRGLDLQGGLRLVYTVDVEEAIKDKRDRYFEEMRNELTKVYGIHTGNERVNNEELNKLNALVTVDKPTTDAATLILKFKKPEDTAKIEGAFVKRFNAEMSRMAGTNPGEVIFKVRAEVETNIRERAVDQAKDTIGRRVDELGLREASVTVRGEDIIVEVPGEDDKNFQEIREIIRKTARLEFKLADDSTDFMGKIEKEATKETLPKGLSFLVQKQPFGKGKTMDVTEARIVRGPQETLLQTRERFEAWIKTLPVPTDHEVGVGILMERDEQGNFEDIGWRSFYLFSKTELTGDQIRDAQTRPDDRRAGGGSGWLVALDFTQTGAARFEEITGSNVHKRFAIILDNTVKSAPNILQKISGGSATITSGGGTATKQLEESKQLELVLRSGALPAPIIPSHEQRIGASLGADSITKGLYGAAAGGGLVLLFMLFYYRVAGLVADIAVLFNLFMQIAILSTFGAAMTLPGIAGLALTIGMAVDANVLINERIREELRLGKTARAAVEIGYEKAMSAIIDGHMTTFIAGLILAQYGTGPIKGFAVTLLVGMVASLFTSVVCTRIVFDWWVRGRKAKTISIGIQVGGQ
jgi:preprotein translocase subunit SecD